MWQVRIDARVYFGSVLNEAIDDDLCYNERRLVPNGYIPGMFLMYSILHQCTFVHTTLMYFVVKCLMGTALWAN